MQRPQFAASALSDDEAAQGGSRPASPAYSEASLSLPHWHDSRAKLASFSGLPPHDVPPRPVSPASSVGSNFAASAHAPPALTQAKHFHLSAASSPAILTNPIHRLEHGIRASRAALAQSQAEAVEPFPDATRATHTEPLIANERSKVEAIYYADMRSVAVYLWVGTRTGRLFEFDAAPFLEHPSKFTARNLPLVGHRYEAHPSGAEIVDIDHVSGGGMYTLDATGRMVVWLPDPQSGSLVSLHGHSRVCQIPPGFSWVQSLGGTIWATWNEAPSAKGDSKRCVLRGYDVSGVGMRLLGEKHWSTDTIDTLGTVCSGCVVPSHPEFHFFGHTSGHVSVWRSDRAEMIDVQKVALVSITALCGPSRYLWVGLETGLLEVIDVSKMGAWRVIKRWRKHKAAVVALGLDKQSLWSASALRVFSVSTDGTIRFWDGLLRQDWICNRMSQLVESYSRFTPLKVGIFTWNVDAQNPDLLASTGPVNRNLLPSFLNTLDGPDLLVFNLQEVIDLSDLTLAARTVLFATRNHDVTGRYKHWQRVLSAAVALTLGPEWVAVGDESLVGLYTAIFARRSVASRIRDLAAHTVKNGFDELYGNKGAVLMRLVMDDSSFCFINAHLAAGKPHHAERARDLIVLLDSRQSFPAPRGDATRNAYIGGGDGTQVSDAETCFFIGDLNFRLQLPRSKVLPGPGSTIRQDQIPSLLEHDELALQRASNPSFRLRDFSEAPIDFPPTYKYDRGTGRYDSSEKQRTPSWCDRILWRGERVHCVSYGSFAADLSDHKPVAGEYIVQTRKVDPLRQSDALRRAVHDWAHVEESLLETARSYYPPEV
ncbi:uncharacterized protein JCM10292_007506 [Rhodotorula paludigena]|uniref:uncharacterized protein n=1 Tax=Rhodotorula paludigena TaxID=86838 RepID=UPI00317A1858